MCEQEYTPNVILRTYMADNRSTVMGNFSLTFFIYVPRTTSLAPVWQGCPRGNGFFQCWLRSPYPGISHLSGSI
jgi:hypothetical protein